MGGTTDGKDAPGGEKAPQDSTMGLVGLLEKLVSGREDQKHLTEASIQDARNELARLTSSMAQAVKDLEAARAEKGTVEADLVAERLARRHDLVRATLGLRDERFVRLAVDELKDGAGDVAKIREWGAKEENVALVGKPSIRETVATTLGLKDERVVRMVLDDLKDDAGDAEKLRLWAADPKNRMFLPVGSARPGATPPPAGRSAGAQVPALERLRAVAGSEESGRMSRMSRVLAGKGLALLGPAGGEQ